MPGCHSNQGGHPPQASPYRAAASTDLLFNNSVNRTLYVPTTLIVRLCPPSDAAWASTQSAASPLVSLEETFPRTSGRAEYLPVGPPSTNRAVRTSV